MGFLLILEREKKIDMREKHRSLATNMHPDRGSTGNPGVCPDWESNLRTFSVWG